jgi:hypothetical protein
LDFWNDYLKWVVATMIAMMAVPYVTARIASALGHVSKKSLVEGLGPNSQLLVGGLGVSIHEFGHAAMAYLFGHKVTHVQLLNFHYAETGTLGSVNHSWNDKNLYQQLGNFFIGLAPYYVSSIALYFLQKVLLHYNLNFTQALSTKTLDSNTISSLITSVFDNFAEMFSQASIPMIIVYLILSVMISSTGYDLSKEDFQTVNQGIIPWLVVLFVIATLAVIFNLTNQLVGLLMIVTIFSLLFLIQSLLYILVSIFFIRIISIF